MYLALICTIFRVNLDSIWADKLKGIRFQAGFDGMARPLFQPDVSLTCSHIRFMFELAPSDPFREVNNVSAARCLEIDY